MLITNLSEWVSYNEMALLEKVFLRTENGFIDSGYSMTLDINAASLLTAIKGAMALPLLVFEIMTICASISFATSAIAVA